MISINTIELSDLDQYAALCDELFGSETDRVQLEKMVKRISTNHDYILVKATDDNKQLSLVKRKEAHMFYESIGYSKNVSQGFKKYLQPPALNSNAILDRYGVLEWIK